MEGIRVLGQLHRGPGPDGISAAGNKMVLQREHRLTPVECIQQRIPAEEGVKLPALVPVRHIIPQVPQTGVR